MIIHSQLTQRNSSRIQVSKIGVVQAKQYLISSDRSQSNQSKRYISFCRCFGSATIIALSGLVIGFGIAQTSPISPETLTIRWNLTFSGAICSILLIGIPTIAAIIGAVLTKCTLAFLSRKLSLVVGSVIVIIGSLIMVIPYQQSLFIGRIIEGMGIGFQMGIATLYLKEISPKLLRTTLSPLMSIGITLGTLLCYFITAMMTLAQYNIQKQAWILVSFNAVFAVIQIFGCFAGLPDSPYQKIGKGQFQDARQVLRYIYHEKFVELQFNQIKIQIELSRQKIQQDNIGSAQTKQIYEKKAGKARGVATLICMYRQLNGGVSMLTYVGPLFTTIANVDSFYPGMTQNISLLATLISTVGNILGVFVVAKFIGRKPLMVISSVILTITNIGSGICCIYYQSMGFFVLIIIQMFAYGLFSMAPGWTYPNQVVPPQKVALQNGLASLGLAIAVFLNPIVYYAMPPQFQLNAFPIFFVYGAINFFSFFVFAFVMVESKDRTYKQIIELY